MQWHGLIKIREQRVSQAQRSLVAARNEESRCQAECAQVQRRIDKLQQSLQLKGALGTQQSVSLDRVIAEQQHRYALHQQIDQQLAQLQQAKETLAKACRVRADKAARYLLMQRKQENALQQLCKEKRVAASRATESEEELTTEQWRANELLS